MFLRLCHKLPTSLKDVKVAAKALSSLAPPADLILAGSPVGLLGEVKIQCGEV